MSLPDKCPEIKICHVVLLVLKLSVQLNAHAETNHQVHFYRFAVFLPLSGDKATNRTKVIQAGIHIAWKENVAELNLLSNVQVDIDFIDTRVRQNVLSLIL